MKDGSDAVSDWPLLNALLNTASGATWVSLHHGGGVGMGYSQHAGMVIVADGTDDAARRLERVLWNDPGTGVMRHADAGYRRRDRLRARAGARPADGRATLKLDPANIDLASIAPDLGGRERASRRCRHAAGGGSRRGGRADRRGRRDGLRRQYRLRPAGQTRIPDERLAELQTQPDPVAQRGPRRARFRATSRG